MSDRNVIERLNEVATQVGAMDKQQVQNFKAFTVDDVYSKLRPLFSKAGVVVVPSVASTKYEHITSKSGTPGISAYVHMDYVFHAPDGSQVTMRVAAEGQDYSDKATNKAVQQAFKYGLIQMFMISTGEVDPDAVTVPERAAEIDWDTQAKKLAVETCNGDKESAQGLYQGFLLEDGADSVPDRASFDRFEAWLSRPMVPETQEPHTETGGNE